MKTLLAGLATVHPGMTLFALTLTCGAYLLGRVLERRTGSALLNPVLFAIVVIGVTLHLLGISYAAYFSGAQLLNLLLGPAVVALAIPLVRALEQIRLNLLPMLAGLLAGALLGMVSGYGLVRVCGGSRQLAFSMLPKSLTTPIAIDVAQTVGGIPSLSAVLAILAGILVAVAINGTSRLVGVDDPSAVGLAAGTAGSGIGASRVVPQHPLSAAFAAVAIGLNGLLTAALAPALAKLLRHW